MAEPAHGPSYADLQAENIALRAEVDNLKTLIYMLEDRHHPDSEWCDEAKEVFK